MENIRIKVHLHGLIEEELENKKSLAALIWLINQGRELEFRIGTTECFISMDRAEKYVSLWAEGEEQSFDSMEQLIGNATINGKTLMASWDEAVIETLF